MILICPRPLFPLNAILRTYDADKLQDKDQGGGPAAVVEYVNKYFFTSKLRGKFITANLFYYDTNTRVLQYTSAGHPMSYVKRRGSQLICLDLSQGIPIGIMKDYQWSNGEIQLREGDILFMYTDVVLETRNAQDNEFGAARLESVIAASDACPHGVVDDVEQALYKFSGQNKLTDDLTLCAIQIKL